MSNFIRPAESHVKLAAPELPAGIRSGGENRPLEYPHLYQIQAGDWRISYAVEHNRLAILVLEVLNPDGTSSKDPVGESMKQKMKVKLLDWPEGTEHSQLPPEEVTKKLKIKWLDLAEEGDAQPEPARIVPRIKLKSAGDKPPVAQVSTGKHRITLLDAGEATIEDEQDADGADSPDVPAHERRTTPLDKPSM